MSRTTMREALAAPLRPSIATLPLVMVRHPAPPPPPPIVSSSVMEARCTHTPGMVVRASVVVGLRTYGDVAVSMGSGSAVSNAVGARECFLYATFLPQLVAVGGEARAASSTAPGPPTHVSLRAPLAAVQRLRMWGQSVVEGDLCSVGTVANGDALRVVVAVVTTAFALVLQCWELRVVDATTLAWVDGSASLAPMWFHLPTHLGSDLWAQCADGATVRLLSVGAVRTHTATPSHTLGSVVVCVVVAGMTVSALVAAHLNLSEVDGGGRITMHGQHWAVHAVPYCVAAAVRSSTVSLVHPQSYVVELLLQRRSDASLATALYGLPDSGAAPPHDAAWRISSTSMRCCCSIDEALEPALVVQAWSAAHGLVVCAATNVGAVVVLDRVFGFDCAGPSGDGTCRALYCRRGVAYVGTQFMPSLSAVDDAMMLPLSERDGVPRQRCVVVLALLDPDEGDVLHLLEVPALQWDARTSALQVVPCQSRIRKRWLGQRMMEQAHPARSAVPLQRCFAAVDVATAAMQVSACVLVEWN